MKDPFIKAMDEAPHFYLKCICCGREAPDVKPEFTTICGVYEQVTGPMCADGQACLKRKNGGKY